MKQLFVVGESKMRERWRQAFPEAQAVGCLVDAASLALAARQTIWLDEAGLDAAERLARRREAVAAGYRVIVMTATPSETEAFQALKDGAVGYCHVGAAPEQLREIALVVEHGGLWMAAELVQRLVALSLRVVPALAPELPELNSLTPREVMVAEKVARGASNREIAEALDITERTVKAHLSVIFDKLGVRDRVQLALSMNNIPAYTAVN